MSRFDRYHFFNHPAPDMDTEEDYSSLRCVASLPARSLYLPKADLFETEDALVARFEIAGCDCQDLRLRILGTALRLIAIRREHSKLAKKVYRQMEIHYGPFERTLSLPCPVDPKNTVARYRDGLLEVFMPKAQRICRRTRVITIQMLEK